MPEASQVPGGPFHGPSIWLLAEMPPVATDSQLVTVMLAA